MFDPNIQDFYERVGRLNKAHARGQGFVAAGLLSRADYRRTPRATRIKLIFPIAFIILAGIALKGTVYYFVGPQTYEARVSELQNGQGFDRLGAAIMQADPATRWVAGAIRESLTSLR